MCSVGLILVFVSLAVFVSTNNESGSMSRPMPLSQPQASKPGALASLAKMIIDIPMGIVEAFKDGAQVIESVIVTVMRSLF